MSTVPFPTPACNRVFHAEFDTVPGLAWRDESGACWFRADDGAVTLLHDADRTALILYGRVDLAALQAELDGDVFSWIERRNTEHARVAA